MKAKGPKSRKKKKNIYIYIKYILIPDEAGLKTGVLQDEKQHFILREGSVYQENITK